MLAMLDMTMTLGAMETGAEGEMVKFFSVAGLMALLTLATLEIVLGIDNVVFIAILSERLPEEKQARTRTIGLLLAAAMRLGLLALAWLIMRLQAPLFDLPFVRETVADPETGEAVRRAIGISGKDLVLLLGGLFLIAKATWEIHHLIEAGDKTVEEAKTGIGPKTASVGMVLAQILMLDLVFSLDSVITAVGMTSNYWIMSTAVVIAVAVMVSLAGPVSAFVKKHPTMKTLALAFLILIGVLLVADGLHQHLDRGYIYFAMVFALAVEIVNMKAGARRRRKREAKAAV
ncbi:MAG: TerC family protein [Phycisphaerales bacterium JB059]